MFDGVEADRPIDDVEDEKDEREKKHVGFVHSWQSRHHQVLFGWFHGTLSRYLDLKTIKVQLKGRAPWSSSTLRTVVEGLIPGLGKVVFKMVVF